MKFTPRLSLLISSLFLAGFAAVALADSPLLILDPLPKPLKLPPGLVETLPLNHSASVFGDALRAVDCTDQEEVRYGICGNQLFGGVVMTDSHLSGNLTIQFYPALNNISHFVVYQGLLTGDDGTLSAPLGYNMPVTGNRVSDALKISSGDLDLTTGYATNLTWYSLFSNTALFALGNVNPKLAPPTITFPGVRGHAWASFRQRADGLLDLTFRGSTFLPLGNDLEGDPIRFPLPYCNPNNVCASVLARGTSLHPHLYLETRQDQEFPACGANCPDIPTDKIQIFTVNARFSAFGDDFDLFIPQQGGSAPGRSELEGRFEIQFGQKAGNTVPFKISAMFPEGFFADTPVSPLLGPGFSGFLSGPNQILRFPLVSYVQHKLYFSDEPFNFVHGLLDLNTGRPIGEFEYPMFIDQAIIEALFSDNNGRVSKDPFFLIAMRPPQNSNDPLYALFEKGPNGQTMFRANLFHRRSFETYCFPQPSLAPNACWTPPDGSGANLNIFGKLQAAHLPDPTNPGPAVMADKQTFTASTGDVFTYNFSIACDPAGKPFSFTYTNNSTSTSGGTFVLQSPASVSCTNSKTSTAGPGQYDQVAITGFGHWSKDKIDDLPRFMSSSFNINPKDPYALIIVYAHKPGEVQTIPGDDLDVNLSSVENKPPTKPTP